MCYTRHYFFERLNVPVDDKTWKKIYLSPCRAAMETNARIFEYEILNDILISMKVIPSPYCSLCGDLWLQSCERLSTETDHTILMFTKFI